MLQRIVKLLLIVLTSAWHACSSNSVFKASRDAKCESFPQAQLWWALEKKLCTKEARFNLPLVKHDLFLRFSDLEHEPSVSQSRLA